MIAAAWIAFIVLLAWAFGDALHDQKNPNQTLASNITGSTKEVTLLRNRYGHYVASGMINGHEVEFLVDTGATDVAIPKSIASRLNLTYGARGVYGTANGYIEAFQTRLDHVALGAIEVRNVRASIVPNMSDDHVLLGMSFLRHLNFSQQDDKLTIHQRINQ